MPWIVPLVGMAVKAYGNKQANDGSKAATAAGLAAQAADRGKAMGVVGDQLKYATGSNPAGRTSQALSDYMDELRGNAGNTAKSYTTVDGANPRYADAVAAASGAATGQTTKRAQFMSILRGMQRNRGDIQQHMLDANTSLSGISQDTNDDMRNAGLAIQKAGQVNPAYAIAGDLISNAGKAYGIGSTNATAGPQYKMPTDDEMLTPVQTDWSGVNNMPKLGNVFGNADW